MSNSFGDDLLEIVDDARSLLGPEDIDLRPTAVTILTRVWGNGVRGDGHSHDTPLVLPDYTKVRHVTQREIAGSGGLYEQGDVLIGPITPQFVDADGTVRGFTEAQLAPVITDSSTEVIYRLSSQVRAGGIVGDYSRLQLQRDRRLRFMLVVGRDRTTPGPI
jgi:hypothetical protein